MGIFNGYCNGSKYYNRKPIYLDMIRELVFKVSTCVLQHKFHYDKMNKVDVY